MSRFGACGVALGCLLLAAAVLVAVSPVQASSVTATSWIELDGSGTRDGLSRSATGVRVLERNVAIAVDPDGDPVAAYIEAPTGNVIVKQLIAGAWQQLGTSPGQGVTPRVKVHRARNTAVDRRGVGRPGRLQRRHRLDRSREPALLRLRA